ncbi:ribosomal protein S5 domain 2-type protein [Naematelia encephala]|uniref:Exosome complex component RRP45 n=1 Tax=Naematelia encephala TaxID=71784 RepID=A0A1Y2AZY1_9TREE|nr:ribosomal protein S5 domain 2-type protein [Naematelia encephala]
MPREIEPPTVQRDFILASLGEGKRIDGRVPLEMRPIKLEFGDELGWCTCHLGKTSVLAQVTASIVKPRDDRPYEGFLLINSEISPMASSVYEAGRNSEDEVLITRMLEKSIRRTEAVDREALCILAGEKVWQLRLTLHFLADQGNLLDCAALAAMTALRHFRKPEIEVIGDEVIVHSPDERAPVPLAIHHVPLCVTFAYFENLPPILDPTHLEAVLSTGSMSLTLNAQRELCVLSKAGGTALAVEEIMSVVNVGVSTVREMVKVMEEALERDRGSRIIEVR